MKTPCRHIEHLILQSLLGDLNDEDTQLVQSHIQSCPACQSYELSMRIQEKELEKMGQKLTKDIDLKQNKVVEALDNLPDNTSGRSYAGTLKFAVAAAVLMIVGLFLYRLNIPFDGAGKVYGMDDVRSLFETARTVHIKGWRFFPDHEDTEPAEVEYWLDAQNGRWHKISPSYNISQGQIDVYVTEEICDGQNIKLSIDHQQESCTYFEFSTFQKNFEIEQTQKTLFHLTCGAPNVFDTYQIQGQETIEGVVYNIWQGQVDMGPVHFMMQSWLAPYTGQMAKAEFWQSADGDKWNRVMQFDIVELNEPIDDSVFEMIVPQNYIATDTIDAPQQMPMPKAIAGLSSVWIEQYLLYDLPDDCLLMCWRNDLKQNPERESDYFADLQFGGPVPQLPAEVYALETEVNGRAYRWNGKHLAFTQKDGKYYEWALYIPEKTPPKKAHRVYIYTWLYRMNNDDRANVTMAGSPDITIEDQADFDKLVIGGMRQLSDDPSMEAPFTLEEVLSLSEKQ